jgi:serine protease Do
LGNRQTASYFLNQSDQIHRFVIITDYYSKSIFLKPILELEHHMSKIQKTSLVASIILLLALSACSGLNLSTLKTSYGLSSQPAQAAGPTLAQAGTPTGELLAAYQGTLEQIYQNVNPSVVNVDVVQTAASSVQVLPNGQQSPFNSPGAQSQQAALGSGFVWDTQGHIVTNNHVVEGADKITVTFTDGTTAAAKLVGADPNSDLAVIKVDLPQSKLIPIELTDSAQVKVGQIAIAIGNPFGLEGTMTVGIVSALDRSLPVNLQDQSTQSTSPTYTIPDIIQTDASINPGNSGGVLVNDQGQLIGVTSAIESTTNANAGVGFVIPSRIVQKVVPSLIKTGSFQHSYLGISGVTLSLDLAQANNLSDSQQGVLIMQVVSNGPAAKAGLQGGSRQVTIDGSQTLAGGDVIVAIDKQPVNQFEDIGSYLFESTIPGQTVDVTVLRNGQQVEIPLTLGILPAS